MNIYDQKNAVRGSDPWLKFRQSLYILLHKLSVKKMVAPAVVFVLITIVLGFAYVADQQILRHGANDPQIQLAEDAAAALAAALRRRPLFLPARKLTFRKVCRPSLL